MKELLVKEVLLHLRALSYIKQVNMNADAWDTLIELDIPELHDRMICSLAISFNCPVITNDDEIRSCVETVWD